MGDRQSKPAEGAGSDGGAERLLLRRAHSALGCDWGWDEHASKSGTVSSLSLDGCFILTGAPGIKGSPIHVHLWLPERRWLRLRGRVLYETERVGLGVAFEGTGASELRELGRLLNYLEENPPAAVR